MASSKKPAFPEAGEIDSIMSDLLADLAGDQTPDGVDDFAAADRTNVNPAAGEDISWDDHDIRSLIKSGIRLAAQGQYEQAVMHFDQAIAFDRTSTRAYHNRGYVLTLLEHYDRAILDFDAAITFAPGFAASYNNRGYAYLGKQQYERAIQDFDRALELEPTLALAHENRGFAAAALGHHDVAIAEFGQAIQLNPDLANAYQNRGTAYLAKGEYEQAIRDLNEAIKQRPNMASAFYHRGIVFLVRGQLDRALSDLSEAVRLQPSFVGAYFRLGDIHRAQSDFERAISTYSIALQYRPDASLAYHARAESYHQLGDYPKAIADFTSLIKFNPRSATAHRGRSIAYAAMGNVDAADRDLRESARLEQPATQARAGRQAMAGETPVEATTNAEDKIVYLMRGLPSCGKSHMAKRLAGATGVVCETDEYFYTQVGEDPASYDYGEKRLPAARRWNFERFQQALAAGRTPVVVDRGNGLNPESQEFAAYAVEHGYRVEFREPDSAWWLEIRALLRDKEVNRAQLEEWVVRLAEMSRETHRVPTDIIRRWMSSWKHNLTIDDFRIQPPNVRQQIIGGSLRLSSSQSS